MASIRHKTLPELVYERAHDTPDRVALTAVEQGSVSWGQLHEASHRWANWLRSNGVQSGDRVVTLVPQSLEAGYVWLGCSIIGAIEVSINAAFRGDWLRHALQASSAQVVVLSARYLDQVLPVLAGTAITALLVYDAQDLKIEGVSARIVTNRPADLPAPILPTTAPSVGMHDIACVLYTSGTTGASKAVQIHWRQLVLSLAVDPAFQRPQEQVFYLPYAPYHLSGRCALYRGALAGGHTVVRESFSTPAFWSDVRQYGCTWTILYAAPTRFLMAVPAKADDADNPLQWVLMCPLLPEVDQVKQRFGVKVYSVYGMTEISNPLLVPPEQAISAKAGCCGLPLDGIEARLVDGNDYPVTAGEVGELVLRSDDPWTFTSGYQGAFQATAKAWRNGWFHTGDMMRTGDDGMFYYVDRSKDMIRRRSENVSSVELEAALLKYPDIAEAAVIGVPSQFGDEDIIAFVIATAGQTVDPEKLTAFLEPIVPRFALPRYIRSVESFPRTQATQRVEKHALRKGAVTPDTWDRERTGTSRTA